MSGKILNHLPLFALGFLSIGFQIFLLREFMVIFQGSEPALGIALSAWIFITGAGAWAARYFGTSLLRKGWDGILTFLTGLMPVPLIISANVLTMIMIPPGTHPGLVQVILINAAVQIPFCFLSGFTFIVLTVVSKNFLVSKSYGIEALGSAAAGLIINLLLIWYADNLQGVFLLSVTYLTIWMICRLHRQFKGKWQTITAFILVSSFLGGLTHVGEQWYVKPFMNQELIARHETPYGRIVITRLGDQLNYYENGVLLFSSGNTIANEEQVHYAMAQHPSPQNVLVISGGFAGLITQVLKYRPKRIDYLELNPSLIHIARHFTRQLHHPAVHVHQEDARNFLDPGSDRYDVVLVNLPPPDNLRLNRYYSLEFIRKLKLSLNPGAVVTWSFPRTGDYFGEKSVHLLRIFDTTVAGQFGQRLIIPGNKLFFLASDSTLSINIPALIRQKGIENTYVNEYYLDIRGMDQQRQKMYDLINQHSETAVNADYSPEAVWYQLGYWLDYYHLNPVFILIPLLVITLLVMRSLNPVNAGLFSGGFTLAAMEIIILYMLQIHTGYVFLLIGMVVTLMMAGMALGSLLSRYILRKKREHFILLQLITGTLPVLLLTLPLTKYENLSTPLTAIGVIILFAAAISLVAGMSYRAAAQLSEQNPLITSAKLYSADMFGGALGLLLATFFMIPLFGMMSTAWILLVMNVLTALIARIRISS